MRMIESKQIQLIHIQKAQLGLSEEDYRTIILAQTKNKKDSSKTLTYFEADALITYCSKTLGAKIKSNYIRTSGAARRGRWQTANDRRSTRQNPGNVFVLPTRDQLNMIDALAGKIVWRVEGGFQLWMKKYLKIDRVKSLEDGQRVIEGLKKMLQHGQGDTAWTG